MISPQIFYIFYIIIFVFDYIDLVISMNIFKSFIAIIALSFLIVNFTQAIAIDPLNQPQRTKQAKQLYTFLVNNYGKFVLSGQTKFSYTDLVAKVNKQPLIQGFDFQNYSPHNPWYNWQPMDDKTVEAAIDWYKSTNRKGIVSFHWHWFSPLGGNLRTSTFYTNNTNFNLTRAVINGTEQYAATMRDLDAIAVQLTRLKNQNIPIIWRPLHEAGGKWFWWGSAKNTDTIKLYNMMFQKYNYQYNLTNLIWQWSTPQPDWYPGNNLVDMIGFDSYPGKYNYQCNDQRFKILNMIVNKRKIVSMSQNGPIPNWQVCLSRGIIWSYFLSWSTLVFQQNEDKHLQDIYNNNQYVKTIENRDKY